MRENKEKRGETREETGAVSFMGKDLHKRTLFPENENTRIFKASCCIFFVDYHEKEADRRE